MRSRYFISLAATTFFIGSTALSDQHRAIHLALDSAGNFILLNENEPFGVDANHPESGLISDAMSPLAAQSDLEDPLNRVVYHATLTLSHDAIIPLGVMTGGLNTLRYTMSDSAFTGGGIIDFGHESFPISNTQSQVFRHVAPGYHANIVKIRSQDAPSGGKLYWLQIDKANPGPVTLSVSLVTQSGFQPPVNEDWMVSGLNASAVASTVIFQDTQAGEIVVDGKITKNGEGELLSASSAASTYLPAALAYDSFITKDANAHDGSSTSNGGLFARGVDAEAKGMNGIALGARSQAGADSFAMGSDTVAYSSGGNSALAFGRGAEAYGGVALGAGETGSYAGIQSLALNGGSAPSFRSVAIGDRTRVSPTSNWTYAFGINSYVGNQEEHEDSIPTSRSFAIGENLKIRGQRSMSLGFNNETRSDYAYSFGAHNSTVTGASNFAMALGYGNSSEVYSILVGSNNRSLPTAQRSAALGDWLTTVYPHETVVGRWSTNTFEPALSLDEIPVFRVGSGVSWGSRFDAVETATSGKTTLRNKKWNEAEPTSLPEEGDGNALVVEGHTLLKGRVILSEPQGDISMGIFGEQ